MAHPLTLPMAAHVGLTSLLYVLLTVVRAPQVWGIGQRADGSNPWAAIEPRISANLSNQFEWPVFFYAACLFLIQNQAEGNTAVLLAWIFVIGRLVHSYVQILTTNIRLRGLVFTINFLATLGLWAVVLQSQALGAAAIQMDRSGCPLAPQAKRWVAMKTNCASLLLGISALGSAANSTAALNEVFSGCGDGWIFSLNGDGSKDQRKALRSAIGIIYGGTHGKFHVVGTSGDPAVLEFEEVAYDKISDSDAPAVLSDQQFKAVLGEEIVAALRAVVNSRAEFYAASKVLWPSEKDLFQTPAAKEYFGAQERAENLLRSRFPIEKYENDVDCD